MDQETEYDERRGSDRDIVKRLDRLEAAVMRVLNMQRLDDLTANPAGILPSNWCTHSGTSMGCSTKSIGCTLTTPPPAQPAG
ncbi:MAG: hypothetical protein IT328_12295 [Caldilineaceae bacterium]|nr:hypothetical protein [Caldilineaceae bacterium]